MKHTLLLATLVVLALAKRGPEGPQGEVGEPGPKGDSGPEGDQGICDTSRGLCPDNPGAKGERGPPGITGQKGVVGDDGARGSDGVQGAKGAQGMPGEPGAKGEPGNPGADGSDGMPGKNAPPCTKDKCLAEKLTTCVDVIARPNHKKGYWQCPTDHVITGFKNTGQFIKNMLVTCCKV